MKTLKIAAWVGGTILVAFAVASVVSADTTGLAVTCTGSVANNVITWNATSTGGNAPYKFAWGGDSSVAGRTSTAIVATYSANGTYNATIQATDASSSVATSTCAAVVTSIGLPAPTSTVNVFVAVNNTAGGFAAPSNFTVNVSGASSTPNNFSGSGTGTAVMVNAGTVYNVSANHLANYSQSLNGSCSNSLSTGASATCTVTETFVPPTTPTPTSTLPHVNKPVLSIGANGQFMAQGMTVTSVGSGTFQGQLWGITYTVNWSGNLLQFYFRGGDKSTTTPSTQLNVGDEVSVIGKVASTTPMVVNASAVRDFNIIIARNPHPPVTHPGNNGNDGDKDNSGKGNGNDNGGGFGGFFGNLKNFLSGHK